MCKSRVLTIARDSYKWQKFRVFRSKSVSHLCHFVERWEKIWSKSWYEWLLEQGSGHIKFEFSSLGMKITQLSNSLCSQTICLIETPFIGNFYGVGKANWLAKKLFSWRIFIYIFYFAESKSNTRAVNSTRTDINEVIEPRSFRPSSRAIYGHRWSIATPIGSCSKASLLPKRRLKKNLFKNFCCIFCQASVLWIVFFWSCCTYFFKLFAFCKNYSAVYFYFVFYYRIFLKWQILQKIFENDIINFFL